MLIFIEKQRWLNPKRVVANHKSIMPFGRYAHASALVGTKVYIFGGHRIQTPIIFMNDLSCIDLTAHLKGKIFLLNIYFTLDQRSPIEFLQVELSEK